MKYICLIIILSSVLFSGCKQEKKTIEESILEKFSYFLASDKLEPKSTLIDSFFNTGDNLRYEYEIENLKSNLNYIFWCNDFDYLKLIFSQELEKDTLHDLEMDIRDLSEGIDVTASAIEDFMTKQSDMHLRMKKKELIINNDDFSLHQPYWVHEGDTLAEPIINDKPFLIDLHKTLISSLISYENKINELKMFLNGYQDRLYPIKED